MAGQTSALASASQPEALDRIAIRRASRQELGLEVVPVEQLDLVPGSVVEHHDGAAAFYLRVFFNQRVEEDLEGLTVTQVENHRA